MTSFIGYKSNVQSKYLQSKITTDSASKIKSKTDLKSTFINTGAHPQSFVTKSNPSKVDMNLEITQSIVFDDKKAGLATRKQKRPKDLKQLIDEKKKLLENEWTKTERYRGKVTSCLG